jgi:uncharacterized membrane protein
MNELTRAQRASDAVTQFFGSWTFVVALTAVTALWILLFGSIDPWPFIFYNLVLTVFSTYQGPLIMMSQNRQADRDRDAVRLLDAKLGKVIALLEKR